MNKKSQIQMIETISIILIFFILLLVGYTFYTNIFKGKVDIEKEETIQLKAIAIAQRVSFLPELQCSEENIVIDNCIDIYKLIAAADIIKNNEIFYYDKLEFSEIKIREIYPNSNEWDLYERPLTDYTSKISTNIPISLYNPTLKHYSFGIMEVNTFSK